MSNELTSLSAIAAKYRFVSVHTVTGISELRTGPTLEIVSAIRLGCGIQGATVVLTRDPDPALVQLDRTAAIGLMMLQGAFGGQGAPRDLLREAERQAEGFAQERRRKFGSTGVYLIVQAEGEQTTTPTETSRDLGNAVVAFDAVDKQALGDKHQPLVRAAVAALALAVDTITDVTKVSDGVALTLPDGRPLHSLSMRAGNVSLTVARPATGEDALKIEKAMVALMQKPDLQSPVRLLVDAFRSTTDRLEAFIFAWAALEMTIRKHTRGCERGAWVEEVPDGDRETAAAIHQAYKDNGHSNYSLAQKARAFALTHGMGTGEDLVAAITPIKNGVREPLYHEGEIANDLPVETLITWLRKIISAAARV